MLHENVNISFVDSSLGHLSNSAICRDKQRVRTRSAQSLDQSSSVQCINERREIRV